MSESDQTITLTPEATNVITGCRHAIDQARMWAMGADLSYEEVEREGEAIVARRRDQVAEMERTFIVSLTSLLTLGMGGSLHIWRDDELSLAWQFSGGYAGGLIFHPNDRSSDVKVGTWSLHS